jgi:hypothetical protein
MRWYVRRLSLDCHVLIVPWQVGFIVGKAGKTILEMQYKSGATITVSGKGEYVAGTTNRTIKIVGPIQAAQVCASIILGSRHDLSFLDRLPTSWCNRRYVAYYVAECYPVLNNNSTDFSFRLLLF